MSHSAVSIGIPGFRLQMRLAHILIAKSIIEALFVAAVALYFLFSAFAPYFRGWGEITDSSVVGWAVNESAPCSRVEVHLFIDGRYVGYRVPDSPRPDVSGARRATDQWHGYSFDIPSRENGEHETRVYAMHESGGGKRRTLQLLGKPLRFTVDSGKARSLSTNDKQA